MAIITGPLLRYDYRENRADSASGQGECFVHWPYHSSLYFFTFPSVSECFLSTCGFRIGNDREKCKKK